MNINVSGNNNYNKTRCDRSQSFSALKKLEIGKDAYVYSNAQKMELLKSFQAFTEFKQFSDKHDCSVFINSFQDKHFGLLSYIAVDVTDKNKETVSFQLNLDDKQQYYIKKDYNSYESPDIAKLKSIMANMTYSEIEKSFQKKQAERNAMKAEDEEFQNRIISVQKQFNSPDCIDEFDFDVSDRMC